MPWTTSRIKKFWDYGMWNLYDILNKLFYNTDINKLIDFNFIGVFERVKWTGSFIKYNIKSNISNHWIFPAGWSWIPADWGYSVDQSFQSMEVLFTFYFVTNMANTIQLLKLYSYDMNEINDIGQHLDLESMNLQIRRILESWIFPWTVIMEHLAHTCGLHNSLPPIVCLRVQRVCANESKRKNINFQFISLN